MESNEYECRVCRMGAEDGRALFTPCFCTGSIGLVHQDCLEAWLAHSKKERCELCSAKYQFVPRYADDAPEFMPWHMFCQSLLQILVWKILPWIFRLVCAIVVWLGVVPFATAIAYRFLIRKNGDYWVQSTPTWAFVQSNIAYGIVLDALIALSLLILMSFTDFLRVNWAQLPNNHANARPVADERREAHRGEAQQRQRQARMRVLRVRTEQMQALHRRPAQQQEGVGVIDNEMPVAAVGDGAGDNGRVDNAESEWETSSGSDSDDYEEPLPAEREIDGAAMHVDERLGENNAFGDLGGNVMGNDEQQDVNEGVRLALFELLGLEGPITTIFRNATWLMAFSTVYLALVASVPLTFGNIILKVVWNRVTTFAHLVPTDLGVLKIIQWSLKISAKEDLPVQFTDFLIMGVGYAVIASMIFLLDCLLCCFPSALLGGLERTVVAAEIRNLAVIVKVCVLLLIRIFLVPLLLGFVIIAILSELVFYATLEDWAQFLAFNAIGGYALAWMAGITFMLSMTISVLQLREVLHPDIFGKLIRPQEAHNDLIISLIQESGLVHARRIVISVFVYLLLMALLIYCPLYCYHQLSSHFPFFPQPYRSLRLWYFLPEIQMPLELLMGHLTFLSILDKKKNWIGRIQHIVVVFMCQHLGLTRFLLPLPIVATRSGRRRRARLDGTTSRSASERQGEDVIGKPLLRPPIGWDSQIAAVSTRWGWGSEEASELELSLADRVAPSFWPIRVAGLIMLFWGILNVIALLLLLLPILVGRAVYELLFFPPPLFHDPLCYAVGLQTIVLLCVVTHYALQLTHCIVKAVREYHRWRVPAKVVELVVLRLMTYICTGYLLALLHHSLFHSKLELDLTWASSSASGGWEMLSAAATGVQALLRFCTTKMIGWQLCRGALVVEVLTYLQLSRRLPFLHADPLMNEREELSLSAVHFFLRQLCRVQLWTVQDQEMMNMFGLNFLEQQIVWPWFDAVCIRSQGALVLVPALATAALAGSSSLDAWLARFFVVQHVVVGLWAVCNVGPALLLRPLTQTYFALNQRIRDERYLVGRTLLNNPQPQGST